MSRLSSLLYRACGGDITSEWIQAVIRIAKRQWRSSFFEFRKAFSRLLREQFGAPSREGSKKFLLNIWRLA